MSNLVITSFASFLMLFFINCSSSDDMQIDDDDMKDTQIKIGNFVSGAHETSGKVSVSSDSKILKFTNFKTDDGPKLLVYLTTKVGSTDYVSLGDLKGISGDYSYAIPLNTNLTKYKTVDIWCVDFSVSFGHADLK